MSKTIPETNRIYQDGSETKFVAYDRIYQNLHKSLTLIQKNGTTYTGKIEKKSIKLEDITISKKDSFAIISSTERKSFPNFKQEYGNLYFLNLKNKKYDLINLTKNFKTPCTPKCINDK